MRLGCLFVVAFCMIPWGGMAARASEEGFFSYHAYLRSGVLDSGKGGKGVPFQAPGAPAKYRLGNEAETYGEAILTRTFHADEPSSVAARVQTLLAYKTQNNNEWSADTDEFTIREAYAEFWNFDLLPGAAFWAGKRYYRRYDIHINDFYWLDTSGYGGGVQHLPFFRDDLKWHLAYLRGTPDDAVDLEGIGAISKQSLDLRLSLDERAWGGLELFVLCSRVKGGVHETRLHRDGEERMVTTEVDSETGVGVGLVHTRNHERGFNNAALMWGQGVAHDFGAALWATPDRLTGDSNRLRVLDYGVVQPVDSLSFMYAGLWDRFDSGEASGGRTDWFSVGVRPVYSLTRHVALAMELGVDHTRVAGAADDGGTRRGTLGKLTLCPEIRMRSDFWARPVLRAFVTLARWSDDFEGAVGGTPYQDRTSGLNFGVQMEAWF